MNRRSLRFGVLLAALASPVAHAQPYLVKDINPATITYAFSSTPEQLINVNGTLFFAADDGTTGYELWKSDGTDAGTTRVKDINPGGASALPVDKSQTVPQVNPLTNVNGTLFFGADDGTTGYELWKSDGTTAGTIRVKDINPGPGGSLTFSVSSPLINVNGTLFFRANDGMNGDELWKSDGTEAGTVRVKHITPGPGTGQQPPYMANVNGTLFFTATDASTGAELWKSDGTEAGTVRVKDIQSGSASSTPSSLTSFNGALFFAATDGMSGTELWKSDGTEAGTLRVKDIRPGDQGSFPIFPVEFNGALFFWASSGVGVSGASRELWKTDGTEAGTVQVSAKASVAGAPVIANGMLFFPAVDSVATVELWRSDGTDAGTVRLTTLNHPDTHGIPNYAAGPARLTNVNGTLFFATSGGGGRELWKSDGTEAGTVRVKDILPGPDSSRPDELTGIGGTVFFSACDVQDLWTGSGANCELWKSDGTDAGTVRVKDIYPGAGSHPVGSRTRALTNVGGTLFFDAYDGTSHGLWKSDGTEAGTVLVKDIEMNCWGPCVDVGGTLFFAGYDATHGYELWRSDGTEAGTFRVKDIRPGQGDSGPQSMINIGGTVFFSADDGTNGAELWKSDGTEAGTVLVKDIWPGSPSSLPQRPINFGGTLFFVASDGPEYELWRSDGTTSGTVRVRERPSGDRSNILGLSTAKVINLNGTLLFAASIGGWKPELWKSDGTEAGTVLVKDINTNPGEGSYPQFLTEVDGKLFFAANPGPFPSGKLGLFRSDGTEAGTVHLRDFCDLSDLTNVNGILFFYAYKIGGCTASAFEPGLWKSDGTVSGTVLVKAVGGPRSLTNVSGTLFFRKPGTTEVELWKSDGSEAGTVLVAGIGTHESNFQDDSMVVAGSRLFFVSTKDIASGKGVYDNDELWALDLLTVLRDGDGCGVVTSAPSGIACGSRCSTSYEFGSLVDLTATPLANSVFAGWSGSCSGTASCQVSMSVPRIATATFSRLTNASNDGDLDGIPDGVEASEGRSPCARDNDIFASARLFAMQQYRDFLGREGDVFGIATWTASIGGGTTRAAVTKSFFDSPEFQGAAAPVTRLYFAYFNRIPDKPGLDYWIGNYRAGLSLNTISQAFAGSPEFTSTYGSLSNGDFVNLIYQNVLGRAPDSTGLAYWTDQLERGLMTRGQVMTGFSESPEYQNSSYNRVFVTMTYYGMLRRAPEQSGFDHWVANLNAGVSSLDLINAFLAAPEYNGRFLP